MEIDYGNYVTFLLLLCSKKFRVFLFSSLELQEDTQLHWRAQSKLKQAMVKNHWDPTRSISNYSLFLSKLQFVEHDVKLDGI